MSEGDFFSPPGSSMMMDDDVGDAPIVLGGPPPEMDTAYLGEVNETSLAGDMPIVLGPTGETEVETADDEEDAAPIVPTGPSPMQKWNEEWLDTLKARKEEESTRKSELVQKSQTDLEAFSAEREMKRQNRMAKNREDEQAKLEAIEADLENDNSWQKVCKMVELSQDSAHKSQDVKRMRDTLILLKNEPVRATTLV